MWADESVHIMKWMWADESVHIMKWMRADESVLIMKWMWTDESVHIMKWMWADESVLVMKWMWADESVYTGQLQNARGIGVIRTYQFQRESGNNCRLFSNETCHKESSKCPPATWMCGANCSSNTQWQCAFSSGNGASLPEGAVWGEPGGRAPLLRTPKDTRMLSKALTMGVCFHKGPAFAEHGGTLHSFERRELVFI